MGVRCVQLPVLLRGGAGTREFISLTALLVLALIVALSGGNPVIAIALVLLAVLL